MQVAQGDLHAGKVVQQGLTACTARPNAQEKVHYPQNMISTVECSRVVL